MAVADILERIHSATQDSAHTLDSMLQIQMLQLHALVAMSFSRLQGASEGGFRRLDASHQNLGAVLGDLPGGLAHALTSTNSPFSAAGNSIDKISNLLLTIPHPLATALGLVGKIVAVGIKLPDIIQNFGLQLAKADMQFAKVSPAMALVEARQELRDVTYGMKMGRILAPSTEELNKAYSRLRTERMDLDVWFKKGQNDLTREAIDKLTVMFHWLKTGEMEMTIKEMPDQPQRDLSEEYKQAFQHYQGFLKQLGLHGKPKRMQNIEGGGGDF